MNPKISVVVPTYNVRLYIRECIESILNQNFSEIEIIIVNDGSTDGSIEEIKDLILNDNRIKVINQKNQGLSAARNTGICVSNGDYISFIDSDDKISPNFLGNLYNVAEKENADIVRSSFCDINGNYLKGWVADFKEKPGNGYDILEEFLDMNVSFVVWSSLYKTSWIKKNKLLFTPGILLEDCDFTVRAYLLANRIATSAERLYFYRVRPNSILTSNDAQKLSKSEAVIVSKFINMLTKTNNEYEARLLKKAIFAFMRDWTRVLAKNNVCLANDRDVFDKALKVISSVPVSFKQRLKMYFKVFLIKIKSRRQ
ncbi:glycosyltransferase [Weissella halotolerans]|nr:glycosyltransferase [Weissella halotolerans]